MVMPISDCPYDSLINQLSCLTKPLFRELDIKYTLTYHISTTAPPQACRPRRRSPDSSKIAIAEFEHISELGITRHLRVSFLYNVSKKTAEN
ncbi:unnamed protein product [Dibothriocephalus latus]|uniref:Uncharacterized protein n=1 Tax=Dibothriocephalus latus TaxID=60516 RepID=A0A3P7PAX3_DIBLA|nr:unnamed protein product [Dibothriocephalus latus]